MASQRHSAVRYVRWLPLAVCGWATPACEACSPERVATPPAQTTAPPVPGKLVDTPTDFALISSPAGATLVWTTHTPTRSILKARQLDRQGEFLGDARTIFEIADPASISDVQASWGQSGLAVVWLSQQERPDAGAVADAWAWLGTPDAGGAAFELRPAWATATSHGGNLALTSRGTNSVALVRGPPERCPGGATGPCHEFSFHDLQQGRAKTGRVTLSVPVPCTSNAARLLSLGERWHYAVCTRDEERSVTTVFSITPSPQYAEAQQLLPGCDPAGLTHVSGLPYLIAECPTGRFAVRVGASEDTQALDLGTPRLRCAAGHYELDAGALSFVLREPRDALQVFVPEKDAQTIWTGQRVLRVKRDPQHLNLEIRRCAASPSPSLTARQGDPTPDTKAGTETLPPHSVQANEKIDRRPIAILSAREDDAGL